MVYVRKCLACGTPIPARQYMCAKDWRRLPLQTRQRLCLKDDKALERVTVLVDALQNNVPLAVMVVPA